MYKMMAKNYYNLQIPINIEFINGFSFFISRVKIKNCYISSTKRE